MYTIYTNESKLTSKIAVIGKSSHCFVVLKVELGCELVSINECPATTAIGFTFGSVCLNVVGLTSVWAL